jgi:F-type H+-transporting ATPase subunit a
MIANRIKDRPSSGTLLAATVAVLLLAGWASPALASGDPNAPGDRMGDVEQKPQAKTETKKKLTKAQTDRKDWEKANAIPMLPALPHFLEWILGEKKGKIIHKWMWVIRPVYALVIVTFMFFILMGVYRKRAILPTRMQTLMEMIVEGLDNMICGILGKKHGRAYLPYLGALFLYIVCLNWFGQVPLMMSPSSFFACTLGLAICTFCVVQYTQWTKLGVGGVISHWAGEPKDVVGYCVAILLIPLHIVEEFIKPLSLGLRLYGNIYGEDVLLGSMLMLGVLLFSFFPANGIPVGFPLMLPFQFLALLLSTIQALVFTLLSAIYILMVLPHDDHEHEEQAESHA